MVTLRDSDIEGNTDFAIDAYTYAHYEGAVAHQTLNLDNVTAESTKYHSAMRVYGYGYNLGMTTQDVTVDGGLITSPSGGVIVDAAVGFGGKVTQTVDLTAANISAPTPVTINPNLQDPDSINQIVTQ